MAPFAAFLSLALMASQPSATFQRGSVTVTEVFEPQRALILDIDVPASLDDVWTAMTTAEGMKTWITPEASVELRVGGEWLAFFPGAKPGGGRITSLVPKTSLGIHAMAPEAFPEVRSVGTEALFTFDARGPAVTHVHLEQTGWRSGDEWDKAFLHLAEGNASLLNSLHDRFVHGPVDWTAIMSKQKPKERQ